MSVMVPVVLLHVIETFAVSPVLMNAAAVNSTVSFKCRVTFFGEMTRSAMVPPVELTGRGVSHANTTAAASAATGMARRRSFSKASRCDSLCLNVIKSAPSLGFASRREARAGIGSWIEELAHVGRRGRGAGEDVHPQAFENQPQRARVLVGGRRLIAPLRLTRTDRRPVDPPAAQRVVPARLIEHDDQQTILLAHRARGRRRGLRRQPSTGRTARPARR